MTDPSAAATRPSADGPNGKRMLELDDEALGILDVDPNSLGDMAMSPDGTLHVRAEDARTGKPLVVTARVDPVSGKTAVQAHRRLRHRGKRDVPVASIINSHRPLWQGNSRHDPMPT